VQCHEGRPMGHERYGHGPQVRRRSSAPGRRGSHRSPATSSCNKS
jgi:hypothetical protein